MSRRIFQYQVLNTLYQMYVNICKKFRKKKSLLKKLKIYIRKRKYFYLRISIN